MVWNPFKSKPKDISKEPVSIFQPSKPIENTDIYNNHIAKKKELLQEGSMSREEILKEIEKQYMTQAIKNDNPFKTRDDMYYCFFTSTMEMSRPPVPFEEIIIAGKKFYINKKFENGKIKIMEMYPTPDIEIDLESEFKKKETTKAQLEKINKYILFIKNQIAKGEEKYNLLDIEDLKEEKLRLEKILSSIKYGKSAIFKFQNPVNMKPSYWMKYSNGEYKYLKVTENNYITEENSVKTIKGQTIITKVQDIINLRIAKNWKDIIIALLTVIIVLGALFVIWKAATFQETLFDKRVTDYCADNIAAYKKQLIDMKDFKCSLVQASGEVVTNQSYNSVR